MKNLIESLIKKFGGTSATAREIGTSPQNVCNWRKRGMSYKAIVELSQRRPDLFPSPVLDKEQV